MALSSAFAQKVGARIESGGNLSLSPCFHLLIRIFFIEFQLNEVINLDQSRVEKLILSGRTLEDKGAILLVEVC